MPAWTSHRSVFQHMPSTGHADSIDFFIIVCMFIVITAKIVVIMFIAIIIRLKTFFVLALASSCRLS